jgi:hypothetical protein
MAADLQPIPLGSQMIGIVDHPGGQPERLAFEGSEERQAGIGHGERFRAEGLSA